LYKRDGPFPHRISPTHRILSSSFRQSTEQGIHNHVNAIDLNAREALLLNDCQLLPGSLGHFGTVRRGTCGRISPLLNGIQVMVSRLAPTPKRTIGFYLRRSSRGSCRRHCGRSCRGSCRRPGWRSCHVARHGGEPCSLKVLRLPPKASGVVILALRAVSVVAILDAKLFGPFVGRFMITRPSHPTVATMRGSVFKDHVSHACFQLMINRSCALDVVSKDSLCPVVTTKSSKQNHGCRCEELHDCFVALTWVFIETCR